MWQDNLFLTRLGEGQVLYRYHDLFAQALRSQLQTQFPAEIPDLHRRAARWYQAQAAPAEAVRHLLAVYIPLANAALSPPELARFLQRVEQKIVAKPSPDQTANEQEVLAEIDRIRRLQAAGEPLTLRSEAATADDEVWPMMDLLVQSQTFARQLAHDKAEALSFSVFEMAQARGNLFVTLSGLPGQRRKSRTCCERNNCRKISAVLY